MKRTIDEHAARFDDKAPDYDRGTDRPLYRACMERVIEAAAPTAEDVVLDLGTGTGAIALELAAAADRVVGRDISEGMLEEARRNADRSGVENVSFGEGRFRDPQYDGPADVITSNYALHHLDDAAKRAAIETMASFSPRRIVLGDLMLFEDPVGDTPGYDPSVDDPARVGALAAAFTEAGLAVTAIDRIAGHVGVIVAEPLDDR